MATRPQYIMQRIYFYRLQDNKKSISKSSKISIKVHQKMRILHKSSSKIQQEKLLIFAITIVPQWPVRAQDNKYRNWEYNLMFRINNNNRKNSKKGIKVHRLLKRLDVKTKNLAKKESTFNDVHKQHVHKILI